MERRNFLKDMAAVGLLLGSSPLASCSKTSPGLKILVLGGTFFVGPAIVNAALRNNHSVTLFNRGLTDPSLFPQLPLIIGDREKGESAYEELKKEHWDVVIDVWPEKSKLVEEATLALSGNTDHYLFISSVAVYNNFQEVGLHENSAVVSLDLPKDEWYYSEEKLAAEMHVQKQFPNAATILRPGPIKGWKDPALDLYYWCHKLRRDSAIVAPGSGNDPLQFIDVNDVARFAIKAVEEGLGGTFNCIGPLKEVLTWKDFLALAKSHFDSSTELIWASEEFLEAHEVASFSDLPLWAPLSEDRGFMQISNQKLIETGFQFTAIVQTLDDCVRWHNQESGKDIKYGGSAAGLGLDRAKEEKLIGLLSGEE